MKTLKLNRDFKRCYSKGAFLSHAALVTYARKNRGNDTRIGVTTSKKIGNAVQRNRARRIIKAACRELKDELPVGYDLVFVARHKTVFLKSTDLVPVMRFHLGKLTQAPGKGKKG